MASGPHRHSHTGSSEAVEDYAKAIYSLQGRSGGEPVSSGDIAAKLGVTAASASGMVKKLAELGLVEHLPYKGVALTEDGERLALEVLRHHRLLELFLADELGMAWDRVHDEADALEHVISPELERLIAAKLGNPTRDPHGDPIPSAALEIEATKTQSLDSLEPGQRGRFVRVSDSDGEMLRYLAEQGIAIDAQIEVRGRQPFGGPTLVRIDGRKHALGGALAAAMRIELARPAKRSGHKRHAVGAQPPGSSASA